MKRIKNVLTVIAFFVVSYFLADGYIDQDACFDSLELNGEVNEGGNYSARKEIKTNQKISGGVVTISAKEAVILKAGFEAKNGVELTINNLGCE